MILSLNNINLKIFLYTLVYWTALVTFLIESLPGGIRLILWLRVVIKLDVNVACLYVGETVHAYMCVPKHNPEKVG